MYTNTTLFIYHNIIDVFYLIIIFFPVLHPKNIKQATGRGDGAKPILILGLPFSRKLKLKLCFDGKTRSEKVFENNGS